MSQSEENLCPPATSDYRAVARETAWNNLHLYDFSKNRKVSSVLKTDTVLSELGAGSRRDEPDNQDLPPVLLLDVLGSSSRPADSLRANCSQSVGNV